MTTIEKIKAEIERRKEKHHEDYKNGDATEFHRIVEDDAILSFLSTLESETAYDTRQYTQRPSVGIEDVARVQFASHIKVFDKKRKAVFDWEQFKEVAGIFYGFGKKDRSDTLESEKPVSNDLEEAAEKHSTEYDSVIWDVLESSNQKTIWKREHKETFIAGAKWQADQTPLPEDTVLFNKGVAEGRRLERDENLDRDTVFWKGMQYARKQMMEEAVEVYPCFDKRRRLTGFSIDPEADGTNGWSCRIILCKIK